MSLAEIERAIGVSPLETISVHPARPLYEACSRMLKSRARRIPLIDIDDETGRETIVSVITQYRILKFIAVNTAQHTMLLKRGLREQGIGTYEHLNAAKMSDQVLDVVTLMVANNISAVPIIDQNGVVLNVFEAVDVIPCIHKTNYDELKATVGEALSRRPDDFPGIYTCQEDDRLDSVFTTPPACARLLTKINLSAGWTSDITHEPSARYDKHCVFSKESDIVHKEDKVLFTAMVQVVLVADEMRHAGFRPPSNCPPMFAS